MHQTEYPDHNDERPRCCGKPMKRLPYRQISAFSCENCHAVFIPNESDRKLHRRLFGDA